MYSSIAMPLCFHCFSKYLCISGCRYPNEMGHMSPYKDQSLGTVHYLYRRKMSKFRYSRTLFLAIIANCHHSAIWPCVTSHPCCAIIPSEITSFVVSGVVCGVRMSLLIPQYWQYALVDILASWSYRKVENNCLEKVFYQKTKDDCGSGWINRVKNLVGDTSFWSLVW